MKKTRIFSKLKELFSDLDAVEVRLGLQKVKKPTISSDELSYTINLQENKAELEYKINKLLDGIED